MSKVELPPYAKLRLIFSPNQLQYLDWLLYQPLYGELKNLLPSEHAAAMDQFYRSLKVIVQDELK